MTKFQAYVNGILVLVTVYPTGNATIQEMVPNESVDWSHPRRMIDVTDIET